MISASGSLAPSEPASSADAVPALALTMRTRPDPSGDAGAPWRGRAAAAGSAGRRGHQRSVTSPAAVPSAKPASTSDG